MYNTNLSLDVDGNLHSWPLIFHGLNNCIFVVTTLGISPDPRSFGGENGYALGHVNSSIGVGMSLNNLETIAVRVMILRVLTGSNIGECDLALHPTSAAAA